MSSLELREASNSTPNPMLPPGRSQARAGDYPSVQGTSGMASTERLATSLGCSFDGSLRDTPATITSGVADTGVDSEVEEHREKPLVPPPQDATATSIDRGAQAAQEEIRAAFPKDSEKSTSKSEPGLDPEPLPMAVSDDSDEMRTQSRKEDADPHDVALRSRLMMRDSPTLVIVEEPEEQISCLSAPIPQVFVTPLEHSEHENVFVLPNAINSVNPPDTTLPDVSPRDDTRNGHTSDGEHTGGCIVFGFKLPWPRQLRCGGN